MSRNQCGKVKIHADWKRQEAKNGTQPNQSFFLCTTTYIDNIKRGDYGEGGREAEAGGTWITERREKRRKAAGKYVEIETLLEREDEWDEGLKTRMREFFLNVLL